MRATTASSAGTMSLRTDRTFGSGERGGAGGGAMTDGGTSLTACGDCPVRHQNSVQPRL